MSYQRLLKTVLKHYCVYFIFFKKLWIIFFICGNKKKCVQKHKTENLNKLLSDPFYDGVVELDDIGVEREEVNLEEEVDVEREEDIERVTQS